MHSWRIFEESWPTGHEPFCAEPTHSEMYYCSSDGSGNYLSIPFRQEHSEEICLKYSNGEEHTLMEVVGV